MFRRRPDAATSRSTKRPIRSIIDAEFGEIKFKRSAASRYVRLRLMPDGRLYATLPPRAAIKMIRQLVDDSRDELRQLVVKSAAKRTVYAHGDRIGQSHRLNIIRSDRDEPRIKMLEQTITVFLPARWLVDGREAQAVLTRACARALRREAEAYLPRRLRHLADLHGFDYDKVRFGNPKGRWGSYSSNGTVSLNIALMNLPLELIDYVLVHELCHSIHPHHQASFWESVAACLPDYKAQRQALRAHSPYL